MSWNDPNRYDRDIARALATAGGHLSIGRGGFTLHYENARIEGYDCDTVKAAAIRAGLPVIDSRSVPFTLVAKTSCGQGTDDRGGRRPAEVRRPWHGAFLRAARGRSRGDIARKVGADVFNIPKSEEHEAIFNEMAAGPLADLFDAWLDHVRAHGQ